ncbi:MAG TPA: helix-turn-helix transcriptional regulator, partial [Phycisphaerales bacterium]|nr:helix-turn-helix transcriptional regulator [Phycisphaerales bacterium]
MSQRPNVTPPHLIRHGAARLREWQEAGLTKDASLAAACRVDTSTISHWRSGVRTAPLGVLDALLQLHQDDPEAVAEILRVFAREYGGGRVRVVVDGDDQLEGDYIHDVADAATAAGELARTVAHAHRDGFVDEREHRQIAQAARQVAQVGTRVERRALVGAR